MNDPSRVGQPECELLSRRTFDQAMQWDADLPTDLVERIWHDAHALVADGQTLQNKFRCRVARIDHPAGTFTWKYHNWGSLRRTLKKSLARSTAKKSWVESRFLSAAGIPTPRTRAFLVRKIGPFQTCSYLLTDYVTGTSLYRLMRFERPSAEIVEHLAQQVAAIWQQLDDLCVWHNDFKPENLLVDPQGKVWLIDLERMRRFKSRDRLRVRQVRDADDLLHPRSWRSDPRMAELFRRAIAATPAGRATLAGPLGPAHPLSRPTPTANRPQQLVTVLIPCRNAADTIVACLESVRDMADEILVADAGSTDDTLALVRKFGGCRIIQRRCEDECEFETWAAPHAKHEWILRLKPDEQLNSELSRQVQDVLAGEPSDDGFIIRRNVYFRGRELRHGTFRSEPSIRLFRKQAAQFEFRNGRLEVRIGTGTVGQIKSRIVYESCPSLRDCLEEIKESAARVARDAREQGLRARRWAFLWKTPWQFLRSYLFKLGCLDGWAGLHASTLVALEAYLCESLHRELERPIVPMTQLVHDRWQGLKVFSPDAAPDADNEREPLRTAA